MADIIPLYDLICDADVTDLPASFRITNPLTSETLTVHEKLGSGGQGYSYRATNEEGTQRTLKFVERSNGMSSADLSDKLQVELRRVNTALNANYSSFQANALNVAVVGDYSPGVNLEQHVLAGNKVLTQTQVIDFLTQISMNYLVPMHQSGIVHKDIKPQNVIVDDEEKYTLIDFGTIRSVDDVATMTATMRGTPGYSKIKADHEVQDDLYSLAKTAYFLFTGSHPEFIGHDTYDKIEDTKKFNALKIDEGLQKVLWKMLGHDTRYDSVEALLHDLEKVVPTHIKPIDARSATELATYREQSIMPSDISQRIEGFTQLFNEKYDGTVPSRNPLSEDDTQALKQTLLDLGYVQSQDVYVRQHKTSNQIDIVKIDGSDNFVRNGDKFVRYAKVKDVKDISNALGDYQPTERWYTAGKIASALSPMCAGASIAALNGSILGTCFGGFLGGVVALVGNRFASPYTNHYDTHGYRIPDVNAFWEHEQSHEPKKKISYISWGGRRAVDVENAVGKLVHYMRTKKDAKALELAFKPVDKFTYEK